MVLCASNTDHSVVKFLDPPADAPIGDHVVFEGFKYEPDTENHIQKKKILELCSPV